MTNREKAKIKGKTMKPQDYINVEELKNEIHKAVNSGDYKELQRQLSETMSGVTREAGKYLDEAGKQLNQAFNFSFQQTQKAESVPTKPKPIKIRTQSVGKVASVLYTVFGSIGLGATVLGLLTTGITIMVLGFHGAAHGTALAILGVLLISFSAMLRAGGKLRGRLKRLERYIKVLGGKTYCTIADMASYSGKPLSFVKKDLQNMIQAGLLPESHLDQDGTYFIADDATYGEYLETQKALYQQVPQKPKVVSDQEEATEKNSTTNSNDGSLNSLVEEGRQYMKKLREINDLIPGEVISEKLYRLENLLGKIFDTVEKRPEQMPRIQRMMDYYLPTTWKMVAAYQEFDSVATQGENITGAKEEIEKTLDAINLAFEKMLDDLYQEAAFDVTTDAAVLKTVLAREGLTESDFKEGN